MSTISFNDWILQELEEPVLYYICISKKPIIYDSKKKFITIKTINIGNNVNSKEKLLNWLTTVSKKMIYGIWIYWNDNPLYFLDKCNTSLSPFHFVDSLKYKMIFPLVKNGNLQSLFMSSFALHNYKTWLENKYIPILSSFENSLLK